MPENLSSLEKELIGAAFGFTDILNTNFKEKGANFFIQMLGLPYLRKISIDIANCSAAELEEVSDWRFNLEIYDGGNNVRVNEKSALKNKFIDYLKQEVPEIQEYKKEEPENS